MSKDNKPQKLSTEPYKGVRDFYPTDMAIQEYIFATWKKAVEGFGYEEYGSSVLEPANLYKSKTSEEIVNEQTYTFIDRGEREVTLRPEITPSVARMVAARKRELSFPLRWYSIPNLYRYEQPQRGRIREFWQLNVDLFGVDSIEADIEVIQLASKVMRAFGAKDSDFIIKINDLRLRNDWFTKRLGIADEETKKQISRTLDRKGKIAESVINEQLLKLVSQDQFEKLRDDLKLDINSFVKLVNLESQNLAVIKIKERLEKLNINNVIFDQSLSRGFDYYTGVVFEIFDTNPSNRRALFGGGRYDDLTSLFGSDRTPAVGFGMGDVTMRDFLETRGLLPANKASADYYICVMSENEADFAMKIAEDLRKKDLRVAVDFSYRKIGDQLKSADKRGIAKVIVIGEEEVRTEKLKVKDMKSGEESELAIYL